MNSREYWAERTSNDKVYEEVFFEYIDVLDERQINLDNPKTLGFIDAAIQRLKSQMTRLCEQGQRLAYVRCKFESLDENNQNDKEERQ